MFETLIPRFPDYELIDSGDFEKLERFGRYVVRRPEPQAIWRRSLTEEEWRRLANASFLRDGRSEERGEWRLRLQSNIYHAFYPSFSTVSTDWPYYTV